MSEDGAISETDAAEEHTATDEDHSRGCFQVSALCCCITRRRMYLPGRRPRDRKKKDWKKDNAGDPCLKDIMLEEGPQNLGQDYWSTTYVGELDSTQTEAIKAGREDPISPLPPMPLSICTQSYDQKNDDQHIPVPLGTFSLEKVEEYDREKTEKTFHTPGEPQQPKEGLDSLNAFSLVTQKKNLVGIVTEGMPFKEGKDCSAMPVKENRQSGSPELLSTLLQEAACEKEQAIEGTCAGGMLEGKPYKELKQDNKYAPSQEPQEPTDLEQLHSMMADNEKKSQEEQNNTITDSEGVTSSQKLLSQSGVPGTKEQQLLEQQPVMGVAHEMEEKVIWKQMDSVFEEEVLKNRDGEDTPHQAQQPGELKYPDILPTMDASVKQELQGELCHLDFASETCSQKTGQSLHDLQEDHLPIMPKTMSFSFQDISYEKKQTEVQDIRNYASDTVLSKGEDHQYFSHQVDQQTAPPENMITFSPGTPYTTDMQRLPCTAFVPQDTVYITGQKQPEPQQIVFGQQIRTPHYNITDDKEEQEGLAHSYFGSKGIICIEEQEYQEPVMFEDVSMLTDSISFEKEQRKLDCGDSGPEGICDKDDQDHQPSLYLDVQEPRVIAKLSSLSLNESSEEQRSRKDSTRAGSLGKSCQDEQQAERDDQGQTIIFASSKERIQSPEEQQPPMGPLAGCNTVGIPLDAWQDQTATSITCEEQKHREQLKLSMTCEEHHKKAKQGLSNTTFPCNVREDEGLM